MTSQTVISLIPNQSNQIDSTKSISGILSNRTEAHHVPYAVVVQWIIHIDSKVSYTGRLKTEGDSAERMFII